MASSTIRAAVVGLGSHANKTVIPAIGAATGWDLAGVVSARPEVAEETASVLGVEVYPDLATAITSDGVDAVYLATVPSLHVEACREALAAGVRTVICEKPLGVDGEEVSLLIAEAEATHCLLYEVMAYQHHPQFVALERLLESPEVGGLVHGYARFSYPFMHADDYRYRKAAGGGSLLDAGIYPLSMATRMLGTGDLPVQGALFHDQWEVDMAGCATLTDDRGRSFQCSWGMGSAYTNLAYLVGTSGTIEVARPFSKPESYAEPMTLIGGRGERTDVEYESADQFVLMLEDIARHRDDAAWRSNALLGIERRWSVLEKVRTAAEQAG